MLHEELTRIWTETGLSVIFVTHNVREAVRLGQRVVLLSSRPGRIAREWRVDIPQPRRIESRPWPSSPRRSPNTCVRRSPGMGRA